MGNRALIASEHTSKFLYRPTMVINSFSPLKEVSDAWGIEHSLPLNIPVSLQTRRPWFLIHSALGERLAIPAMLVEIEHLLPVNVPVSLRNRRP